MSDTQTFPQRLFGNNRPPVNEIIEMEIPDALQEYDQALADLSQIDPKGIDSEESLATAGKAIERAKRAGRWLDEKRQDIKRPILNAGREIDAFFRDRQDNVQAKIGPIQNGANAFMRARQARIDEEKRREADRLRLEAEKAERKAAEAKSDQAAANAAAKAAEADARADHLENTDIKAAPVKAAGVTSSTRKTYDAEIVDWEKLDLNRLKDFMSRADIEKAARSWARTTKGNGAPIPGIRAITKETATFRS